MRDVNPIAVATAVDRLVAEVKAEGQNAYVFTLLLLDDGFRVGEEGSMATRKEANGRRSPKCRVTIDPADPEAGRRGVVPPEATRFRPSRSGNPKGRPAGAETSFERIMEQELDRLVEGDPSFGDEGADRNYKLRSGGHVRQN